MIHIDKLLSRQVFNVSNVLFHQKHIVVPEKTDFFRQIYEDVDTKEQAVLFRGVTLESDAYLNVVTCVHAVTSEMSMI